MGWTSSDNDLIPRAPTVLIHLPSLQSRRWMGDGRKEPGFHRSVSLVEIEVY